MTDAYLVGYGTFVASDIVKTAMKVSYLPDELVYIGNHQRFLGVVSGNIEEAFRNGELIQRDRARVTVEMSGGFRYNAALYQVSNEILHRLDEAEAPLHFVRLQLDPQCIITFDKNVQWQGENKPIFAYAAEREIKSPQGTLTIVRKDINPDSAYVKACREAALGRGQTFRDAFDETTFLADRVTPLSKTPYVA